MSDIIERLWEVCARLPAGSPDRAVLVEGADEIERLRERTEILEAEIRVMRLLPGAIAAAMDKQ